MGATQTSTLEQTNVNLPKPRFTVSPKECLHCNHRWLPRKPGRPGMCPRCKRPNWDRPRRKPASR